MSKRPAWTVVRGPVSWPEAVELAHKGRRDVLAWKIANEAIPEALRPEVAKIIVDPPPLARPPKARFLPHEVEWIRAAYAERLERLRRGDGSLPPGAVKRVQLELVEVFGGTWESMRELIEGRKSYAAHGEKVKSSPRKKRSP